jgi:superfamily I DNA/RNA helicase
MFRLNLTNKGDMKDEPPIADRPRSGLNEGYQTKRRMFHVACIRARDQLQLSRVELVSKFFADLSAKNAGMSERL